MLLQNSTPGRVRARDPMDAVSSLRLGFGIPSDPTPVDGRHVLPRRRADAPAAIWRRTSAPVARSRTWCGDTARRRPAATRTRNRARAPRDLLPRAAPSVGGRAPRLRPLVDRVRIGRTVEMPHALELPGVRRARTTVLPPRRRRRMLPTVSQVCPPSSPLDDLPTAARLRGIRRLGSSGSLRVDAKKPPKWGPLTPSLAPCVEFRTNLPCSCPSSVRHSSASPPRRALRRLTPYNTPLLPPCLAGSTTDRPTAHRRAMVIRCLVESGSTRSTSAAAERVVRAYIHWIDYRRVKRRDPA